MSWRLAIPVCKCGGWNRGAGEKAVEKPASLLVYIGLDRSVFSIVWITEV